MSDNKKGNNTDYQPVGETNQRNFERNDSADTVRTRDGAPVVNNTKSSDNPTPPPTKK